MHHRRILAISFSVILGLTALALAEKTEAKHAGIDLAGTDTSVKPYEDFYQYANGKWLATAKIPPDRPAISMGTQLQDRNREILHDILERAAKDTQAPKGGTVSLVGAFYKSGMDEARIEAAGAQPLQPEFERIAAVSDLAGLLKELAHLHLLSVPAAFRFGSSPDIKNSSQMIGHFHQGGLGLPDRDYYLKTDDRTKSIRAAYLATIQKMLTLLGDAADRAAAQAHTILDLETRLAKASRTRVELRDPASNYHKMTLGEMDALTPQVSWKVYFEACGLPQLGDLNVGQPGFLKELGSMLTSVPLADWKTYLRWHLLSTYAENLSAAFDAEDFHFKETVIRGIPQMQPRWQRILTETDHLLGEALGQLYVTKTFPPEAKATAERMVANLKAALHDRLSTLDWMSPATRGQALKKLAAIAVKIGYPDKWQDYTGLDVYHDVYALNVMEAERFENRRELAKIGKPVDRSEWGMTPPTVNAYYNPSQNEIVFPAGILQPPLFDASADDAVNYGGIGAVIGHELTHGFDDQGRQFDAHGNLHNWWTPEDAKVFNERAAAIARQYDGYVVIDKLTINGKLTLGENIADLGGLKLAYVALQKALAGKPRSKIDGFTPEQRFFLAFAQLWRSKMRPEMLRLMIATNPHSPPRFRVLGPLYNMPEFFKAFGASPAQAGKNLNPHPVQIW